MKVYKNIKKSDWATLSQRPIVESAQLTETVNTILDAVKLDGDQALRKFALQYDKVALSSLKVSADEIALAVAAIPADLKTAIGVAKKNITTFHATQCKPEPIVETMPGVKCWRKNIAIEKVGLYIPGGTAPLFSTILMLGIPAKLAGCKELVLCTPCAEDGKVNPAILYTANLVGINRIYKVGGAQAIAAMGYGTETIPQVYKIFGPGNQYVTKAKEIIQLSGIAIDMPAGPSELLVIADKLSNPAFIASDLLSQAEHGADSQVLLLSDDFSTIERTVVEINKQIQDLPRSIIAQKALENSKAILLNNLDACFDFSNFYAPEHLIVAVQDVNQYVDQVRNAGSVFLGSYSCESAGDYASGTNHTLPTNGNAKSYSGVSVDSFMKKVTFQEITSEGLQQIGNSIEIMAAAEGLEAHKKAVSIRLKSITDD